MSNSTISLFELMKLYPDEESAHTYFVKRVWGDGVICPNCREDEKITARKNRYYRCRDCKKDFTIRTGTIMERSHIPLQKWLFAMYMLMTARKGISSLQLAKEIGITQKSAWFLLQRLREACVDRREQLDGIIEIDETYISGKERNHNKKKRVGRGKCG